MMRPTSIAAVTEPPGEWKKIGSLRFPCRAQAGRGAGVEGAVRRDPLGTARTAGVGFALGNEEDDRRRGWIFLRRRRGLILLRRRRGPGGACRLGMRRSGKHAGRNDQDQASYAPPHGGTLAQFERAAQP
jgi:hypothetical protein